MSQTYRCPIPICNSLIPRDQPMCATHLSFVPKAERDELHAALDAVRHFAGPNQGRWISARTKAVASAMAAMKSAQPTNAGGR